MIHFIRTRLSLRYVFLGIFVIYVTITINLLSWISKNYQPDRKIRTRFIDSRDAAVKEMSQEIHDNEGQALESNTDINSHIIFENSMKRKRKILAELIQEYQQNPDAPKDPHFTFQTIGNISVFSAFYDDRLNLDYDAAVVRILGIAPLDSLETLVCRYTDKGVDSWVLASKYEMCENHGKTYGGFVYFCNTPRNLQFVPRKVYVQSLSGLNTNSSSNKSVALDLIQIQRKYTMKALEQNYDYGFEDNFYQSDNDDDDDFDDDNNNVKEENDNQSNDKVSQLTTTKFKKLTDNSSQAEKVHSRKLQFYDMQKDFDNHPQNESVYKIAVCIPPLFGKIPLSNFIQFVEFHRLQNVNHFFFYPKNITNDLYKVLKYYKEQNIATTINWELPPFAEDQIWYNGQIVAIQDCLYRTMGHYDYVAFLDIDEIIIPKLDSNWTALLQRLQKTFPDTDVTLSKGFSFKSAFFDPDKFHENPNHFQGQIHLSFLKNLHRNDVFSGVRTKVIVNPEFIVEMGIHHVSQTLNMLFNVTIHEVSPNIASIHHYRSCTTVSDKRMICGDDVKDNSILKFERSLVNNYMNVVKSNMPYFKRLEKNKKLFSRK